MLPTITGIKETRLTTKPGQILVTESLTKLGITTTTVESSIITEPEVQGCYKDGVQYFVSVGTCNLQ